MRWKRAKRGNGKFKISIFKIILPGSILLIILFWVLIIRSNIFTIKSIDIQAEKVECVGYDQIKRSSNILGQTIFFINSSQIEKDLKKQFICIKNVETSRNFPDKVKLSVSGREEAAILIVLKSEEATSSGELESFSKKESTPSAEASPSANFNFSTEGPTEIFVIDNEGIIYSNHIEQINVPRIFISGINLSLGFKMEESILNTLKILQKVKTFGVDIKDAKMYSERILLLNAVPRIIFRLDEKQDTQIASLQLILNKAKIGDENLEFIDLRFDKPVIRLAPKKN